MKKIILAITIFLSTISFSEIKNINDIAKDYPYKDSGMKATVLGTPIEQFYKLKSIKIPKIRKFTTTKNVPEILKEWQDYEYGIWVQKKEAPLMILISGTGSVYKSGMTFYLSNFFNEKGYNVIALSSPTTMPYIVSQSKYEYAGYIKDETKHLYDLISEAIKNAKNKDKMKISKVYIGGYSLGGFQSLLLHEMDSEKKEIGIERSLILNSPISMLTATQILDNFLIKNDIYDAKGLEKYLDKKFSKIINSNKIELKDINFKNLLEALVKLGVEEEDFEILTGLLFRFYSANMVFAGDIFYENNKKNYKKYSSITKEFKRNLSVSFDEYMKDYLYPLLLKYYPNKSFDEFINEFSLKNSEKFINEYNKDIIFITSTDDFLITEEDLAYIKNTFHNRVLIPFGGHIGVLWHKDLVELMINKLEEK